MLASFTVNKMKLYEITIVITALIISRGNSAITTANYNALETQLSEKNMIGAIDYIFNLPGSSSDREPGYTKIRDACISEENIKKLTCCLHLDYTIRHEHFGGSNFKNEVKRETKTSLDWVMREKRYMQSEVIVFLQDNPETTIFHLYDIISRIYNDDWGNFNNIIDLYDNITTELVNEERHLKVKRVEVVGYGKLIDLLKDKNYLSSEMFIWTIVVRLKYLYFYSQTAPFFCSCTQEIQASISKLHRNLQNFIKAEYVFISYPHQDRVLRMDPSDKYIYATFQNRIDSPDAADANPEVNNFHYSRWYFKPHSHRNRTFFIINAYNTNLIMYVDGGELRCKYHKLIHNSYDNYVLWQTSREYIPEALFTLQTFIDYSTDIKQIHYNRFTIYNPYTGGCIFSKQQGSTWNTLLYSDGVEVKSPCQSRSEDMWDFSKYVYTEKHGAKISWSYDQNKPIFHRNASNYFGF